MHHRPTALPLCARLDPRAAALACLLTLLGACSPDTSAPDATGADSATTDIDGAGDAGPKPDLAAKAKLATVKETERWQMPGLKGEVWVVRTESNVPHVYAENREDLARVHAFVAARDRFFLIDMMRRLGLGRLTEVFGDVALASDLDSRGTGMAAVADRVVSMMTPEMKAMTQAYAEGINHYIDRVRAGELPPPSEVKLAAPLLGYKKPADAMKPFTLRDMGGVLTVVLFQQGYETGDIRRAQVRQTLEKAAKDAPDAALRKAGLLQDVFDAVAPLHPVTTTPGYGVNGSATPGKSGKTDRAKLPAGATPPVSAAARPLFGGPVPDALFTQVHGRLDRLSRVLGKAERGEFGSNIWTVAGDKAEGGAALLASDGHLALEVPSLFWRVGIDTRVLGGGDTSQLGVTFAGLPMVGAGTNGDVAWSNTYLYSDITDYYREEITLDDAGRPKTSRFKGADKALKRVDEVYEVADIALLNSVGGKRTWPRWELFDGRRLVGVEGRVATDEEVAGTAKLPKGQAVVAMLGTFVVPQDLDKDGVITGISMDLTTLDVGDTAGAVWDFSHAKGIDSFHASQRKLVGWAQNMMVADKDGHILYSGYNATPCRNYLERTPDGHFAADADPRLLIDGTKYQGFEIPLKDGLVDETPGKTDPYRCVIPFDDWPVGRDPKDGFLVNANNDFGNTSLDGKLGDDPWYLGGPWVLGFRAKAIADRVAESVAQGKASVATMSAIQGTHHSMLGELLVPAMLAAIDKAKASQGATDADSKRLHALYLSEQATMDVVRDRLDAWGKAGFSAESGVETFYHQPTAQDRTDSVATMVFNAWATELLHGVYDDEGVPFDAMVALRGLANLLAGRGPDNPKKLASWHKDRQESVLFDITSTPEIERSDEVLLLALVEALTRLRAKPSAPGEGGFGTPDITAWRWGLRHMLHLDSILASFLQGVQGLSALTEMFSISTDIHPLAKGMDTDDPRKKLKHFPRPGDYGAVDAAHPHAIRKATFPDDGVRDFRFNHGPIMRMVVGLHPDGRVEGVTILPGGQSALTDSPHFADQVRLWLANKVEPMRFSVDDVVAGATGREVLVPAGR